MEFYTAEEIQAAQRRLRRCAYMLGGWLLVLLALYVWATLRGARGAMLALMLLAFVAAVFAGDLFFLPAWRYVRFLCALESGLRRRTDCVVEAIAGAAEMQDGERVRALEARLLPDGGTRIFYVNASMEERYPPRGEAVILTSCGRHVVGWEAVKGKGV